MSDHNDALGTWAAVAEWLTRQDLPCDRTVYMPHGRFGLLYVGSPSGLVEYIAMGLNGFMGIYDGQNMGHIRDFCYDDPDFPGCVVDWVSKMTRSAT